MLYCFANRRRLSETGHPTGFGIDRERGGCERYAIGHVPCTVMQPHDPGLASKRPRQGQFAELQQGHSEHAAKNGGVEQIVEQMSEPTPQALSRRELPFAA